MAITADAQQLTVPLEKIHVPGNVRSLDVEHVQALAGSIRLQRASSRSSSPPQPPMWRREAGSLSSPRDFTASPPPLIWA
jgi:hypothetical protein